MYLLGVMLRYGCVRRFNSMKLGLQLHYRSFTFTLFTLRITPYLSYEYAYAQENGSAVSVFNLKKDIGTYINLDSVVLCTQCDASY